MKTDKYKRYSQTATNIFIFYKDEYLMLKRAADKKIDPNKLNGIGGRLEPGENFLDAGIREVFEETGYEVSASDFEFTGLVKLEGGYSEDWIMSYFKCRVNNKNIPKGNETEDGKLVWLHKDKVLDSGYEVISDLKYLWKDIVEGQPFFATAIINKDEEVDSIKISKLAA
jgi:8-oxo-dGTP pyrophosphatase MutT (NUDIX family)